MLILASQSLARQSLLRNAGLAFVAVSPGLDERAVENSLALGKTAPRASVALALARAKALAVGVDRADDFVIGADQTLECGTLEIHQPRTRDAAASQLRALAGKAHKLHSAVALVRGGAVIWDHVAAADLVLRDFSDAELDHVLDLEDGANLGSVGGYRLEGPSIRLFEAVTGDYFTILGLPLLPLLEALARFAPQTLKGAAR